MVHTMRPMPVLELSHILSPRPYFQPLLEALEDELTLLSEARTETLAPALSAL